MEPSMHIMDQLLMTELTAILQQSKSKGSKIFWTDGTAPMAEKTKFTITK